MRFIIFDLATINLFLEDGYTIEAIHEKEKRLIRELIFQNCYSRVDDRQVCLGDPDGRAPIEHNDDRHAFGGIVTFSNAKGATCKAEYRNKQDLERKVARMRKGRTGIRWTAVPFHQPDAIPIPITEGAFVASLKSLQEAGNV